MSKYAVGDKFVIEIKEVLNDELPYDTENLYRIDGFKTLVFDDYGLDKLQQINPQLKIEDIDDMLAEYDLKKESYEKGLQDAWKLYMMCLEMPRNEFCKILGIEICTLGELFESIEPQEALAKIEAYEKSQIKVGDVIAIDDDKIIVTKVIKGEPCTTIYGIEQNGCAICYSAKQFEKTGQTIDISHLLEQIRGNE